MDNQESGSLCKKYQCARQSQAAERRKKMNAGHKQKIKKNYTEENFADGGNEQCYSFTCVNESYRAFGDITRNRFIDLYTRQGMYVTLTSLYKKDLV